MQAALKRLHPCQEEVPGFVSGANLAWQGSDAHKQARPARHVPSSPYTLSTRIPLAILTLTAVFQSLPCRVFVFIFYPSPLICCVSGVTPAARRANNITAEPSSSHRAGGWETFCFCTGRSFISVSSEWCKLAGALIKQLFDMLHFLITLERLQYHIKHALSFSNTGIQTL